MSSEYVIGNILMVVLRSCHLAVYHKLRKNNLPLAVIAVIVACLPTIQPFFRYGASADYRSVGAAIFFMLFISALYAKFVFDCTYRQMFFSVCSVGIFGNLCQVLAISFCRMALGEPEFTYGFLVNRIAEAICLLVFLPALVLMARKPFMLILNEIGKTRWYFTQLVPAVLYVLSLTVAFLTLTNPGGQTLILGIFFIANTLSFYWIIYFMTTQRRFNRFLSRVVESSQNMIPYYRYYMEELGKKETRIRTLRHDLRHVMGSLAIAAKNGDAGKIIEMAKEITALKDDAAAAAFSPNASINSVISFYFSIAGEKGVKCKAELSIPETLPFSDAEMAMLVGNALENSVKAAIPLGEEGWIGVDGKMVHESLVLKVTNNFAPGHVKPGEGIGLESMRMLCEKHAGNLRTESTENEFKLVAILCIEPEIPENIPNFE